MGTLEFEFLDDHRWLVDPVIRFVVYTGLVSVYTQMGGGPLFGFVGTFRLGQSFPFPIGFPAPAPPMPPLSPMPPMYPWAAPQGSD